jgi:hypothetical protein
MRAFFTGRSFHIFINDERAGRLITQAARSNILTK